MVKSPICFFYLFYIADECPPGTKEQSGFCLLCDFDTYQPQGGQTTCIPCPDGQKTAIKGATQKIDCKGKLKQHRIYTYKLLTCLKGILSVRLLI